MLKARLKRNKLALSIGLCGLVALTDARAVDITGTWLYEDANGQLLSTLTFLNDGRYLQSSMLTFDPTHTGVEWGTYTWDAQTGLVTPFVLGDTNGDWGVSNAIDGPLHFTVTGNTATYARYDPLNNGANAFQITFGRIVAQSSPLSGSWLIDAHHVAVDDNGNNTTESAFIAATFLDDGRYVDAAVIISNGHVDAEHTGVEWGTYNWNSTTSEISAVSLGDTNGDWGFAGDVDGNQFIRVNGAASAYLFQPPCGYDDGCDGPISRILPIGAVVPNFLSGQFPEGFSYSYTLLDVQGIAQLVASGAFASPDFILPGNLLQLFDLSASGALTNPLEITFTYDPGALPEGFDESLLRVFHWTGSGWENLGGEVDATNNTISVTTNSLSPFAVAAVPEPATYALMLAGLGLIGFAARLQK